MSGTNLSIQPTMLFRTLKGSKYYVGSKSSTQRIKSLHSGEVAGYKEASDMTVYVSREVADSVASKTAGSFWLCFHRERLIKIHSLDGKVTPVEMVEYSTVPQVGLCPVQFWKFRNIGCEIMHPRFLHIGNEIVSIEPVYLVARELYERDLANGRVNF